MLAPSLIFVFWVMLHGQLEGSESHRLIRCFYLLQGEGRASGWASCFTPVGLRRLCAVS